jgi:hypothetical protein
LRLTHDASNEPLVKGPNGNAKQEETHGELGQTYGDEIQGLSNEVELERLFEVLRLNVLDMSSGAVVNLGNDDALSCNTLQGGQSFE